MEKLQPIGFISMDGIKNVNGQLMIKEPCATIYKTSLVYDDVPVFTAGQMNDFVAARTKEKAVRIADLEAKLAQSQTELAELRGVHRQMVNDAQGLGKKLIEDTCG